MASLEKRADRATCTSFPRRLFGMSCDFSTSITSCASWSSTSPLAMACCCCSVSRCWSLFWRCACNVECRCYVCTQCKYAYLSCQHLSVGVQSHLTPFCCCCIAFALVFFQLFLLLSEQSSSAVSCHVDQRDDMQKNAGIGVSKNLLSLALSLVSQILLIGLEFAIFLWTQMIHQQTAQEPCQQLVDNGVVSPHILEVGLIQLPGHFHGMRAECFARVVLISWQDLQNLLVEGWCFQQWFLDSHSAKVTRMNELQMWQLEQPWILAIEVSILEAIWIDWLWNTGSVIEVAGKQDMIQAVSFLRYASILLEECVVVEYQRNLQDLLVAMRHVVWHLNLAAFAVMLQRWCWFHQEWLLEEQVLLKRVYKEKKRVGIFYNKEQATLLIQSWFISIDRLSIVNIYIRP